MRLVLLLLTINVVTGESASSDSIDRLLQNFNEETFDVLLTKLGTNWTDRNQETALHISARNGYYSTAEALIKKDPQLVNVTNKYHRIPLHFAAWKGHCDIVKLLVENGADVNALTEYSESALYLAAMNANVECVRILLDNGADINIKNDAGETALHFSSQFGRYKIVKLLIGRGANVNIKNNNNETPLHYAARNGHCDIVKLLVENGADVNAFARFNNDDSTTFPSVSALQLAARYGHTKCLRILLKKGANINQQDYIGRTPIHIASQFDRYDVVKALINKNPQLVNIANKYHQTPLHFAAWSGHCDIIKLLLLNGADVNALAKFTYDDSITSPSVSALYLAARYGSVECVRILLNNGAEINHEGLTALQIATQQEHYDVAKLLIERGADNNGKTALELTLLTLCFVLILLLGCCKFSGILSFDVGHLYF